MKMKATINIYGKSIEQIMDEITANIENLEKKPSTRSKTMEE